MSEGDRWFLSTSRKHFISISLWSFRSAPYTAMCSHSWGDPHHSWRAALSPIDAATSGLYQAALPSYAWSAIHALYFVHVLISKVPLAHTSHGYEKPMYLNKLTCSTQLLYQMADCSLSTEFNKSSKPWENLKVQPIRESRHHCKGP